EAVWAYHVPKAALAPPSPEARRNLVTRRVDEVSDDPANPNPPKGLVEYFRRDASGRVSDTQYDLVSRGEVGQEPTASDGGAFEPWTPWGGRRWDFQPQPRQQQPGGWGGFFGWLQPQPQPPAPCCYDPAGPPAPPSHPYPHYS